MEFHSLKENPSAFGPSQESKGCIPFFKGRQRPRFLHLWKYVRDAMVVLFALTVEGMAAEKADHVVAENTDDIHVRAIF